ncbi:FHA domain-containing protein [Marinicella litoralis]|uniref:FHA domain-containing protein n=1 Tax=Marinicella litoralis TaxID=644220 RepID=A0A4R6XRX1_9GAMM|nr:FHA domain-containing protein [Marinicella litoralis]TDR22662.1 FHA domain-containing protein [Marinicella litoralis]
MHLVIETTKKSFPFPENNVLVVGNDFDCDLQINHPKIWGRHFSIEKKSYGCVLNVYDQGVSVNGLPIAEKCLLDSGDLIQIDDMPFRLVDDQYIPKDSVLNHTNVVLDKAKNVSSVFGVRSFADTAAGFFIIDDFHHPDGWHVFRNENELHYIDNKHKTNLNGLAIAQAKLVNGDVIANSHYKYKIELPGTSGFSKFSPSHPRNVQLSESFNDKDQQPPEAQQKKTSFVKNNLWWLTLLVGLVVLLIVVINNPPG